MSNFTDLVNNGFSAISKDPTAAPLASLTALAGSLVGPEASAVTALVNSAKAHMEAELANLPVKLSVLSAVETMEKRLGLLAGTAPGTSGGTNLADSFKSMSTLGTTISNLTASIQSGVGSIESAVSGAAGSISNMIAAETASFEANAERVKNFAFATFLATPKSPALAALISQSYTVPPAIKYEQKFMALASQKLAGATAIPDREPIAKASPSITIEPDQNPTVDPRPQVSPEAWLVAYNASNDANDEAFRKKDLLRAAQKVGKAWQDARGYKAIKDSAGESPENQAAYKALKEEFLLTPEYINWKNAGDAYTEAYNEWKRLHTITLSLVAS